ncbi:NAD(P)-binding protein [Melanomma pulvis-pyrius CBS 109.77]|uniref:NAD(P)-binding protein n=1 Tax=Melanomma pulvis-pyrius CBS 109.77 TaxID=1314802 RepID=A0A6A6XJL2_9PLEO|nr:NAD(P)-binding protein [Melanomma pulvis-pyrius CBS 109.77]
MPSSNFDANSFPDLHGKIYLVTGGNSGIGKITVIGLASRGATVYMGARSEGKATATIDEIKKEFPDVDIKFIHMDLTKLSSVVEATNRLKQETTMLSGLINNAGVMGVPYSLTGDGYEIQFQTNYLSHWLLTSLLTPLLLSTSLVSGPGSVRVINLTSNGHERFIPKSGIQFDNIGLESSNSMTRYGQSKLAQILHINKLNSLYGPRGTEVGEIWFAAVHPGHIDTDLNRQATGVAPAMISGPITRIMRCLGILDDQEKGAWSSLFAVASSDFESTNSGAYVVPYAKIGTPSKEARDERLTEKLWEWTKKELEGREVLA